MNELKNATKRISDRLKLITDLGDNLVYIGRFSPMHYGHQAIIQSMIQVAPNNHLVLLGSCNTPIAKRHLFKFTDRLNFIKTIFPEAKLAGLPDFPGDNESWFASLDHIIALTGKDPKKTTFIGGCDADVQWFKDNGRQWTVVDRKWGITHDISGTEIRNFLANGDKESLANFIDGRILDKVIETFKQRWNEYNEFISR